MNRGGNIYERGLNTIMSWKFIEWRGNTMIRGRTTINGGRNTMNRRGILRTNK